MSTPDTAFDLGDAQESGGVLRAELTGELAWDSADELLDMLRARLDSAPAPSELRLDCAGLTLCDSMGLSTLLALHRCATAVGARLHLDRRPPFLDRMLVLTGTYEHLTGRSETAGPDGDTPSGFADGPQRPGR
ncbi:STAS domain-containing protein [Streptomyces sp. NPDC056362]|uniref:STAS domain-containing protein n=1 Tax=unclassified Streptomyces TaxID=2593676 RepID=UPI002E77B67E|nr:STAS domain-containing protein [Streptomyces sp. SP18ES09]MEE1820273.1 STAS domain-containing protein [Streptomyces sp. SP18ES09]